MNTTITRLLSAILVIVATVGSTSYSNERPVAHVILISIDGLRPEFYLDPTWPAPMLQQMAAEGVHAKGVTGVFPSVTYPSHTTMITGAMPARHGIYYNSPFEPEGYTGKWYWEADSIKVRTLWQAVKDKALTSASLSWPVSVNAPVDFNIPEIWPLDRNTDLLAPLRAVTKPDGLFNELEERATGSIQSKWYNLDNLMRDHKVASMAAYIVEQYKPNFMTIHLVEVDHFQHEQGRDGDMVRRSVVAADHAVSIIEEACRRAGIAKKTAFIVTGDHGFVDIHTRIAPNIWLMQAGLMDAQRGLDNWRATFHTSGAAAFLHLRTPGDAEALEQARTAIENQPSSIRKLFRIVEKDELAAAGAAPDVPLALAPVPGINFSASTRGEVLAAVSGGTHGFFPDFDEIQTGFIGWGAGFRSKVVVPKMGLEDISPIVIDLLDLDMKVPDGILLPGLIVRQ